MECILDYLLAAKRYTLQEKCDNTAYISAAFIIANSEQEISSNFSEQLDPE